MVTPESSRANAIPYGAAYASPLGERCRWVIDQIVHLPLTA
jgi:hypothetical protein